MTPRLHCPDARPNWTGALPPEQARKLFRVLRLRPGGEVILFDGAGGEYAAKLDALRPDAATARVVATRPAPLADIGLRARVGQALCAPNKMDWAVEKMTELGALEIIPLQTAKSAAAKFDLQRAKRLAVAACEQCGRARLPEVAAPMLLTNFLARPFDGAHKIALSPRADRTLPEVLRDASTTMPPPRGGAPAPPRTQPSPPPRGGAPAPPRTQPEPADASSTTTMSSSTEIVFLCGPEAGFTAAEEERMTAAGFIPAKLGGRILRAETAALTALAMLLGTEA